MQVWFNDGHWRWKKWRKSHKDAFGKRLEGWVKLKAYREVVRPAVTYNVDNKKTGARLQGFWPEWRGPAQVDHLGAKDRETRLR